VQKNLQPCARTRQIKRVQIGLPAPFLWDFCPVLQECGTGSPFFHAAVFRILVLRHYKYNFLLFLKLLNFMCNSINYEQRQNAQK